MIHSVLAALAVVFFLLPTWASAEKFVHRKTGRVGEGRILVREAKDGRERILVEAKDGKTGWIWADEWDVKIDRQPSGPAEKPDDSTSDTSQEASNPGDGVGVDFGEHARTGEAGPGLRKVVASGVGLNPEEALQNAFSGAIEQAVGVLVDAETVIQNDEIIRDKVLTYSRAFVQNYLVIRRWQDGGLHHAKIDATVSVDKLVKKLKAAKIAVREVSGELMSRQLKHEVASEQDAAGMFARAMEQYRMEQLWTVQIDGKPEVVDKDSTHARLAVKATLTPNERKWGDLLRALKPLLDRIATKKSTCTCQTSRYHYGCLPHVTKPSVEDLAKRLEGDGIVVAVMTKLNRSVTVTEWTLYRVPDSLAAVLKDVEARQWNLALSLTDESDAVIAKQVRDLSVGVGMGGLVLVPEYAFSGGLLRHHVGTHVLSPLPWRCGGALRTSFYPSPPFSFEIDVPLDRLSDVTKCVVNLDETTAE